MKQEFKKTEQFEGSPDVPAGHTRLTRRAWIGAAASGVAVRDMNDLAAIKREHAVPPALISCHTSTVGGYTMEGHVPNHHHQAVVNVKIIP